MASVKIKLRPATDEGRVGTIFYQVTHRRATKQITTNIRLHPHEWNVIDEQVASFVENKSMIQNKIDSDIALLKRIIKDLERTDVAYSVSDIIKRYKSPGSRVLVLDFMRMQIEQMRNSNRLGTTLSYEKTMRNFSEFLGDVNLPFSAVTEQLIADYNAFLVQRGMVRNSVSFYMRIMRAVYNKAVRLKLIEQSNPFTEVYTGIDRHESVLYQKISLHNCTNWSYRKGLP